MQPLLGTFVEIAAVPASGAAASDEQMTQRAITQAFAAVRGIHETMSFHAPDSELSRLNGSRGAFVPLSRAVVGLLRLAVRLGRLSGGLFNCTVGGALVKRGRLPDHGFDELLDAGTAEDVELCRGGARLRRPVAVTLDGIAKGYAVDQAVQALKSQGVGAGWVNAGGDLRVFGDLSLPLQLRRTDGQLASLGSLRDAAVATSVTRPAAEDGFPGLVIGPESRAVECGEWTVISRSAWRADALTKVAALAEPKARDALLARLGGRRLIAPADVVMESR